MVAAPQCGKSSSRVDSSALRLQPSTAVAVPARRTAGRGKGSCSQCPHTTCIRRTRAQRWLCCKRARVNSSSHENNACAEDCSRETFEASSRIKREPRPWWVTWLLQLSACLGLKSMISRAVASQGTSWVCSHLLSVSQGHGGSRGCCSSKVAMSSPENSAEGVKGYRASFQRNLLTLGGGGRWH